VSAPCFFQNTFRTSIAAIISGHAMRICIFGAGAIGGYLGVQLALPKIPTPSIDVVLALVAQRAKIAELY
jgi:hypothetical protein